MTHQGAANQPLPAAPTTPDTRAIHRQLVASGRATWLGDDLDDLRRLPLPNDAARVAHRVRALFGSARAEEDLAAILQATPFARPAAARWSECHLTKQAFPYDNVARGLR